MTTRKIEATHLEVGMTIMYLGKPREIVKLEAREDGPADVCGTAYWVRGFSGKLAGMTICFGQFVEVVD